MVLLNVFVNRLYCCLCEYSLLFTIYILTPCMVGSNPDFHHALPWSNSILHGLTISQLSPASTRLQKAWLRFALRFCIWSDCTLSIHKIAPNG